MLSLTDLLFPFISTYLRRFLTKQNFRMIVVGILALLISYIFRIIFSYVVSYYGHIMGTRIEKI